MKKLLFLTFGVVAILLASHIESLACSCIDLGYENLPAFVKAAPASADTIFLGTALQVNADDRKQQTDKIRFKVERSWKGSVPEEVNIFTGNGGGDCGFRFKVGKKYLVYANTHKNELHTTFCHRTNDIADAAEDLKILGEGKAVGNHEKAVEAGYTYRIGQDVMIDNGKTLFLTVSIERKTYDKAKLVATMRTVGKRFPAVPALSILILDKFASAKTISAVRQHNPDYEKDHAALRGYYSLNRETSAEDIEFSVKRGEPEEKFDLATPSK